MGPSVKCWHVGMRPAFGPQSPCRKSIMEGTCNPSHGEGRRADPGHSGARLVYLEISWPVRYPFSHTHKKTQINKKEKVENV